MTLSFEDREILIEYRLEQAISTYQTALFLFENNEYEACINRIYYGIFYSLLALGIKFGFETSKHKQLIGWFNKTFVSTGNISKEYGRILRDSYNNRRKSDYDAYINFESGEVRSQLNDMKNFINIISLTIKGHK